MRISDVKHQDRAHRILQRALASRRLPHGYIFHGPAGVGRHMMAMRLAALLLCPNLRRVEAPTASPENGNSVEWRDACGSCPDCRLLQAQTHPDLHLVTKELHQHHPDPQVRQRQGFQLSVEVIRHFLIEPAYIRSANARAKIFIVLQAERMSHSAQNALLKTLEEPPAETFIILMVEQTDQLLPTILSRCQHVAFCALPADFVRRQLRQQRELPAPAAHFLAAHSDGRLGLALEYADDQLFELKRPLLTAWAQHDNAGPTQLARRIEQAAAKLAEHRRQRDPELSQPDATRTSLRTMLAVLAGAYRDAILLINHTEQERTNLDQPEVIDNVAARWAQKTPDVIRLIAHAEQQIEQNVNPTLALESLIVRAWSRRVRSATPGRQISERYA